MGCGVCCCDCDSGRGWLKVVDLVFLFDFYSYRRHTTHPSLPALGLGQDSRLGLCARDFPLPPFPSDPPLIIRNVNQNILSLLVYSLVSVLFLLHFALAHHNHDHITGSSKNTSRAHARTMKRCSCSSPCWQWAPTRGTGRRCSAWQKGTSRRAQGY